MSDTLLIHYNINQPSSAVWSLCNDAGELTGKLTSGSLQQVAELAATHPVIVLLNSQCLHINELQLPTQNMQKMLKAIPYALEEYIAEDVDDFHFVINRNKSRNTTAVVGIDKKTLQQIIDQFEQTGIHLEKIYPDALCLAAIDDEQWVCLNNGTDSYLQTGQYQGVVTQHSILPVFLYNRLDDESIKRPEKLLLFTEQENSDAFSELTSDKHFEQFNIEIINISYNQHPLVVFCGNYKSIAPLNLLQHDFKPKRQTTGYWHHWRLAASLAAVWMTLHLGLTAYQGAQLKEENELARIEIEKIYKRAFPQSKKIIDPRSQMKQKLKELKSGAGNSNNGLLYLLSESFGTLGSDKENITLQSLTFRNNRMDIGLDSKNLQAVENLNKHLNDNSNIKSQITSSTSDKDKVKGNLRIESRS